MKSRSNRQQIPILDVLSVRTLPTRCPSCGFAGDLVTDGKWPETTRAVCPHNCGWSARYRLREETANV